MPTLTEVQEQIFAREGFRVSFDRNGAPHEIPPYDYPVMAPNGWKISDWKTARLGRYVALLRGVTVYRGDGEPARDVKLGNLRDGYYAAEYGSTAPPDNAPLAPVTDLAAHRSTRKAPRRDR